MYFIDKSNYKNIIRENNTWIALINGYTQEEKSKITIEHNFNIVKFEMPDYEHLKKLKIKNCQRDAIWFYLNVLDKYNTMSYERMINAADLPEKIVEKIPYINIPFKKASALISNYKTLKLFGY